MTRAEMVRLGWDALDVLIVTGDAYVDHPSFGAALLGRWLVAHGYRVGIVAQPRWDTTAEISRMGRPRLFAGVTSGALDSMLAHYTAFRKKRSDDAYTPGGRAGARPNRATIVYTGLVKAAFPRLPVIVGGIEASLRRCTHYDFWSDDLRRSILLDSKADLLLYGMAERSLLEAADRLRSIVEGGGRFSAESLRGIRGSAFAAGASEDAVPPGEPRIELPSHEEIAAEPAKLLVAALALEEQVHGGTAWALQRSGDRVVVVTPPAAPLSTAEMDALYSLPFTRRTHPSHRGKVPAEEMIRFSVTSHRGCAGGCSFCSLSMHQGRRIQSRSAESILREIAQLTAHHAWKGSLSDIGGPTANMWGSTCTAAAGRCRRRSCLFPSICPNFRDGQEEMVELLRAAARVPGVRNVRVSSGVRFDLALRSPGYLRALVREFVGGQLKVAPEHVSGSVLKLMRKPGRAVFEEFLRIFEAESRAAGKEQYIVPYLMSAFPGCTDAEMQELSAWLRRRGWRPRQVQCFVPTPGTVASAMFYCARDPDLGAIRVARTDAERLRQHRALVGRWGGSLGTLDCGIDKPALAPFMRARPGSRVADLRGRKRGDGADRRRK